MHCTPGLGFYYQCINLKQTNNLVYVSWFALNLCIGETSKRLDKSPNKGQIKSVCLLHNKITSERGQPLCKGQKARSRSCFGGSTVKSYYFTNLPDDTSSPVVFEPLWQILLIFLAVWFIHIVIEDGAFIHPEGVSKAPCRGGRGWAAQIVQGEVGAGRPTGFQGPPHFTWSLAPAHLHG